MTFLAKAVRQELVANVEFLLVFFQVVLLYNHSAHQDCGIVDNHLFTNFSGTIVLIVYTVSYYYILYVVHTAIVKDHVKSVLRMRSAGLHSNGRDPTIGMLLIFCTFRTFLN